MISARGKDSMTYPFARGPKNLYDKESNPEGIVSFANAENFLVHDYVIDHLNQHPPFEHELCSYNEGATGPLRLRKAMAEHVNAHFSPCHSVTSEEITFASGVTSLNEMMALSLCDPGDIILAGGPIYGSFNNDLLNRTSCEILYMDFDGVDPFSTDVIPIYERAISNADRIAFASDANPLPSTEKMGARIGFLLICNPHNPTGRCYPKETLAGLIDLCARYNVHLVSDEIYALSVFRDTPSRPNFTSVLSIGSTHANASQLVHVLYGMSKDFACAGLRLGCLITRNQALSRAVWSTCRFSCPSEFSSALAVHMLEDKAFVSAFVSKSRSALAAAYDRATGLLDEAAIPYNGDGNAGFFIWMDLSKYLRTTEGSDEWEAERGLKQRFVDAGVILACGEDYFSEEAGNFRLVFTLPTDSLEEGIRRIRKVLESSV